MEWWAENPCLFFEIRPEGASYGFILWRPSTAALENFRRGISQKPEEFLELLKQTEKATGIPVTADLYKRPKVTDDPRLEPYFAWRDNIDCTRNIEVGPELFGPELAERVRKDLNAMIPLYEYFNRFCLQKGDAL